MDIATTRVILKTYHKHKPNRFTVTGA